MDARNTLRERRLRTVLGDLLPTAVRWSGACYRCAAPRWCDAEHFFDGEGARLSGGRWNPPGLRAAYASTEPEVALAESLANARHVGIPDASSLPLVVGWGDVRLRRVLDLSTRRVRRRLRCSRRELLQADWQSVDPRATLPLTQEIGALAAEVGFEALLAPSAAVRGGLTLVVFPDALRAGSRLVPHGLHATPPGGT